MKFGMKFQTGQNKDYKQTLQKRRKIFMGMIILGASVGLLSVFLLDTGSHSASFTRGFGMGLFAVGVVFLFKNWQMLNNEEKLNKNKMEEFDERNIAIDNRALVAALRVFILLLALISIVMAFINPIYSMISAGMIGIFLVLYLAFYFYYQKKM